MVNLSQLMCYIETNGADEPEVLDPANDTASAPNPDEVLIRLPAACVGHARGCD